MLSLLKYLNLPWELARGYLRQDLDAIEYVVNHFKSAIADGSNQLKPAAFGSGSIPGNGAPATRYVANTGPQNAPQWDQVNLANGVKGLLPYANFVNATGPAIVGAPGAGPYQQITPSSEDVFVGSQLLDVASLAVAARYYGAL